MNDVLLLIRRRCPKMMCLTAIIVLMIVVRIDFMLVSADDRDPASEVEVLPEAIRNERKKVLIFWSIMYEVCQTFCVWKKFCNPFCELFNIEDEPRFDMGFFKESKNSRQTLWLYDTATKICESDLLCVEKCLKMELNSEDYDQTLRSKETTDNVFKALYDIAKKYFIKCAEQNDKPEENVDLLTVDDFCQEATNGWSEYIQKCISSLTEEAR
ncbi:uncharacterized protein LOC135845642 [Planococcus citri]|uniref:uncharacterized protein LOC135845642 n=1 Tax=Planococcus citri TaxID=170843 RepID=UPI0031F7299D